MTTQTYDAMLIEPTRKFNVDQLVLMLYEIRTKGIELPAGRAGQIISIAAEQGLVRLALDLAEQEEGEHGNDLETQVWVDILRTSAERYFVSQGQAAPSGGLSGGRSCLFPRCVADRRRRSRLGKGSAHGRL